MGFVNQEIDNHPLVGVDAVYKEHETPTPRGGDGRIVVGNGYPVTILAAFENWNAVEGLDMLYVSVPWTGHTTHLTPEDLGLNSVHSYL